MFNPKEINSDATFNENEWNGETVEGKKFFHRINVLYRCYLNEKELGYETVTEFVYFIVSMMHKHWQEKLLTDREFAHLVDEAMCY